MGCIRMEMEIPRKNKKKMVEIKNTVKEVKNPSMVSSVGLNV